MANFIAMVYATLKNEGIDTKGLSADEAVEKFKELQKKTGGKEGHKEPTPAENRKLAADGGDAKEKVEQSAKDVASGKKDTDAGTYKGYAIEKDFYGNGEYTVQFEGDDVVFKTEEEAKKFIDEQVGGGSDSAVAEDSKNYASDIDKYADHYGYDAKEAHKYIDEQLAKGRPYKAVAEEVKDKMANDEPIGKSEGNHRQGSPAEEARLAEKGYNSPVNGKLSDLNAEELVDKALKQGSTFTERGDKNGSDYYTISLDPRQDGSIWVDVVEHTGDDNYDADDRRHYKDVQTRVINKKYNNREEAINAIKEFQNKKGTPAEERKLGKIETAENSERIRKINAPIDKENKELAEIYKGDKGFYQRFRHELETNPEFVEEIKRIFGGKR